MANPLRIQIGSTAGRIYYAAIQISLFYVNLCATLDTAIAIAASTGVQIIICLSDHTNFSTTGSERASQHHEMHNYSGLKEYRISLLLESSVSVKAYLSNQSSDLS
ncbi:hypothetical protein HK100_011379 [Physocladia obscura]|uniref:Uncharacterized protein n=1 Tax=Physocladia obscura TaxID=109957 RepID=A0AAD5T187_9FUNG|nr:hypothetical protein HK100_011379 [Physocladia obscura]